MDTRRDFIYVNDLIDVVMRALDGAGQRGYYHVSSGSDYAIKELYDQTVAALGLKDLPPVEVRPRSPDDVFSILLDPSRTNQDFGWRTSTSLATGVQRAIDYYREFGIQETYTHLKALSE